MPDKVSSYRWVILSITWLSFLTVFLVRLGIGPLGPFLKESLQISHTQITALSSAIGITYLPALIVAGWLAMALSGAISIGFMSLVREDRKRI